MPNRILKESICESRKLSEVSFFAEDLYKRLITYADDYGRFNADCQIILARLYPREIGIVNIDDIENAMTELIGIGKIAFYTSGRTEIYGCFPNWSEHQRVRDSKKKCPEPQGTEINDWYLKRFVSKNMKRFILERDEMKCQECGKYIFSDAQSADRAIKFGAGLFHIDHIIPVNQGGRATEENLRLLCPTCNLRRKRHFTIEEIIEFTQKDATCKNSQKLAETCGKLQPNPIQSNPNPNPNPNPISVRETQKRFRPPTVEEVAAYCKERNNGVDPQRFVDFYESKGWMVGKSPMKSWKACVRTWEERDKKPSKTVVAQQYGQRDYSGVQDELMDQQQKEYERRIREKQMKKVNAQLYEQRDYSGVQNELIAEQDKEMEEYMKSEKGAST